MKITIKTKVIIVTAVLLCIAGAVGLMAWFVHVELEKLDSGTRGNIKLYRANRSKKVVHELVETYFLAYPSHRVPPHLTDWTIPYRFSYNDSINVHTSMNADSVNFFFYIPESDMIIWSGFSGMEDNWTKDRCILALIGISGAQGRYRYKKDLEEYEIRDLRSYFQQEVLGKLDGVKFTPIDEN